MIEIAEAKYIVDQINHHLIERTITKVEVMNTPHRFAWLNENATDYENRLCNQRIKKAKQNGSMVRILMGNDVELVFSEDVYFAYLKADLGTTKNQLALNFDNDMRLEVRTKLYGFLMIGKEAGLKISNP
ncbi:MAG: hypothetical protein IH571_01475, partial [Acholeplasmataceae bacterium]|nr:hypothetical protein [Acholeplasmataceae bacterium]